MTNETKKEVDIAEFKSLVESYHKILGLDLSLIHISEPTRRS